MEKVMRAIPGRPEDIDAETVNELVREVYPRAAVESVRLVKAYNFGEPNVSTSARAALEVKYGLEGGDDLPYPLLVKIGHAAGDAW